MQGSARHVVTGTNTVIHHAVRAFAVFVIVARDTCVRTGLIVIPAIGTILTLLGLTNASGHQGLQFRPQLRDVIVSGLDCVSGKGHIRKIHAARCILNAITSLPAAGLDVLQRGPQFRDMIISDLDDISRKRDIGKRHGGQPTPREFKIDLNPQFLDVVIPRLYRISRKRWIRPCRRIG
jgi:hypothetical protein